MTDDVPPQSLLDGAALFLDFDGTLVELAEEPGAIVVPPELGPLLARLARRLDGRLAVVSGRALADLHNHLDADALFVSGSHGLELQLGAGRRREPVIPEQLAAVREEAARFAEGKAGILIENKPSSVAIHYRRAPEQGASVADFVSRLASQTGFAIQEGKMVFELLPAGADKGDALRALMAEPEFRGARPVFVGDDLTDENAFRAAVEMGGDGVLVGPPRRSEARWRLADVGAVMRWLGQAAGE